MFHGGYLASVHGVGVQNKRNELIEGITSWFFPSVSLDYHRPLSATLRPSSNLTEYFGFVKGLLVAITSVIYLFVLTAFFILQHAVLIAGKVTGSVVDWSPEKPRVFGMSPASFHISASNSRKDSRFEKLRAGRISITSLRGLDFSSLAVPNRMLTMIRLGPLAVDP